MTSLPVQNTRLGKKGIITNIQQYSLHDGPGIRTTVFFKGCPLRCRWCCNPETQAAAPELSYVERKCICKQECGWCAGVCPTEALSFAANGKAQINRARCTSCFECVRICPSQALRREGQAMSVADVLAAVEEQSVFYREGKGGLTVSGGEPLSQPKFLLALLEEAKHQNLNTAMETSGYGEYAVLAQAMRYLDTLFFDIKSLDEAKHQDYTTVSNRRIVENLTQLRRDYPNAYITVRTPVIHGLNDLPEEQTAIRAYVRQMPNTAFEALPCHRFGEPKYATLGREYTFMSGQSS
ncbi:4-hydroxyphenylacetate decarboxylase activating enzyme [Bacteroidales bacterium Barb6]|nr:4-hydroxyphenylacetate decarboxylase activating enzyme [Bacteroidales bacterium Barb6]